MFNGTTNRLIVGINFKINPPNSGKINCNENRIVDDYVKYNIGTRLRCHAKANSILGAFPPIVFDSWSGNLAPKSNNNLAITLAASHYGTLVANFKEIIPSEFLTRNILIPVILGTIIPAIIAWVFARGAEDICTDI